MLVGERHDFPTLETFQSEETLSSRPAESARPPSHLYLANPNVTYSAFFARLGFVLLLLGMPGLRADESFVSLFNGQDLEGWSGNESFWSVRNGVIHGETTKENPTDGNTFLVWQGGEVGDFVFKTKVRFKGNNSGVQYRSELIDPANFVIKGYQADLHKSPEYFGMLYAEKWRGIVAKRFQKVEVGADGKPKVVGEVGDRDQSLVDWEWNELTIIAVGDRQIHQVNGVITMDLTDNHPEAKRSGILALQLHAGPPMTCEFKDIRLRKLNANEGSDVLKSLAQAETTSKAKSKPKRNDATSFEWVAKSPKPQWIWRSERSESNDPLYLRHTFHLPSEAKSARLYATCDNEATVWINGKVVGDCPDWKYPIKNTNARSFLKAGKNTIAVKAANRGGVAAFVFKLHVEMADGSVQHIVSDTNWKLADEVSGQWQTGAVNAANWNAKSKTLGEFGKQPWGQPGIGADQASGSGYYDADQITVPEGFHVELIHTVPKPRQGSWVSLTVDEQGRLYASDQGDAGLFRITVEDKDDGGKPEVTVEKMPVKVSGAQGMTWHRDALYFNRGSSPLYRLTDSTGDGLLDHAEELTSSHGGGEHGNHAVIETEDGDALYVVAGNHTNLPEASMLSGSRIPTWDEDLLLPREWDANGHARGRLAPGGWITRFDPSTNLHEVISMGYRNQYDVALNRAGDLFTYDADMEWDLGAPWYRPTRINHAVSGSDYGWRSGSGKWPEYYEDSLPAVLNIGPGSPTGVVSGQGTKFPAKYQDAIFALDWTFGTIYAIHLRPDGAGWKAEQEPFCFGTPLPVTDAIVGHDGALYFTVGGRGTQSALFRITYDGDAATQPVSSAIAGESARQQRRQLEAFHGKVDAGALQAAWPMMSSPDRWLRHAARIAVESQPTDQWADRVLTADNTQARITGAVALARRGTEEHRGALLDALLEMNPSELPESQLLGLLRAYALTFIRLGDPTAEQRSAVIAELDPLLPHNSKDVNTELVRLLVRLESPSVIAKAIELMYNAEPSRPAWVENVDFSRNQGYGSRIIKMLENQPPSHEINYAFMLRNVRKGWTMPQLRAYIQFINQAAKYSGGNSYGKFLANLRDEVLGHLSNSQREQLSDISGEDFNPVPDFPITPPKGPGKLWTLAEARKHTGGGSLRGASFESGRNLFHAAQCASCHRFDGLGGDIGPDLTTVKNKFNADYLLESIIDPSKVISDQYGSKVVLMEDGRVLTGLVVESEDQVEIYPVSQSGETPEPVVVQPDEIVSAKESPISQMPTAMLNALNENEVRDLIAYLLSGGDPKARVYGR